MKIGILSENAESYHTRRLTEACRTIEGKPLVVPGEYQKSPRNRHCGKDHFFFGKNTATQKPKIQKDKINA